MSSRSRPAKKVVTEYLDPEDEPIPEQEFEDPADATLRSIAAQFGGGDVLVKVYRQSGTGKEYCYSGGVDINEESIRASGYGPGKYLLQILINGELRKSIPIAIAGPVNGGIAAQPEGGLSKLLLDRLTMLEQRLLRPVEREPINDLADAMLKISQIQNQSTPKDLPIDTLMKCIELGKSLAGESGGDFGSVVKDVLKESLPMISSFLSAGRGAAAPESKGLAPSTAAPTTEAEAVDLFEQQLKGVLVYLKRKCIAGSDPGLYIDWVVENRDEAIYQHLIRAAVTSEFSKFAALDPEISQPPYDQFFRTIYDGLRSAFAPADSVAVDPGGAHGNKAHTGNNGAAGKRSGK
jgi:hypothetical protein